LKVYPGKLLITKNKGGSKMKKIIHLSDIHVGFNGDVLIQRFVAIIRNIIKLKQPATDYAVVITGDITDYASEENFENALACVEMLRAEGYKVLVVPGNHDCGTGSIGSRKKLKLFMKMFYGDPDFKFPKKDILGETAFIGLNSMEDELHWFHKEFFDALGADGELGPKQLKSLDDLLAEDDVKKCKYRVIYLHHHPVKKVDFLHELKDKEELGKVIMKHKNVDALLCGHEHVPDVFNGTYGVPRVYNAGTSTFKLKQKSVHRVIDLSRPPKEDYDARFLEGYTF
jgi:3',5'-cyclic AMP phosphodiesterase CpdA